MTDLKYICSSLKNKRHSKRGLVQEWKLFEAKRMLKICNNISAEFFHSDEWRLDFYQMNLKSWFFVSFSSRKKKKMLIVKAYYWIGKIAIPHDMELSQIGSSQKRGELSIMEINCSGLNKIYLLNWRPAR